ncbi:MAG: hypothetical protein AAGH76_10480, partial [Pseudomonadota bacterium]
FSDFGVVTTSAATGPALTRAIVNQLAAAKPDVIVIELGDGLLGSYGVEAILSADDIRAGLTAVVLCANDPVGAWGGVQLLRERFSIEPTVITGPASDNQVGIDIVHRSTDLVAINALTNGPDLGDFVAAAVGLGASQ